MDQSTNQRRSRKILDPLRSSSSCYHFLLALIQQQNADANEKHHLYQRYIAPVLLEIETNYAHPLTVAELAEKIFVTPQYLSRLFQRFWGSQPPNFAELSPESCQRIIGRRASSGYPRCRFLGRNPRCKSFHCFKSWRYSKEVSPTLSLIFGFQDILPLSHLINKFLLFKCKPTYSSYNKSIT